MVASKELPAFVISPSILAAIQEKGDDWVPPREVLDAKMKELNSTGEYQCKNSGRRDNSGT